MYFVKCDCSIEPFNPGGILAWAFVVKRNKKLVHQACATSDRGRDATNNRGEYHAVIAALLWLLRLEEPLPAIVMSDSELIINQITGKWRCKDQELARLRDVAVRAVKSYKSRITFKWIPREKNTEADALSRTAYDEEELQYFRDNKLDIIFEGDDVPF